MSEGESQKQEQGQKAACAAPEQVEEHEEFAGAVPARRGKRRNCMFIPGTSDPMVAKLFSQALLKEVLGKEEEVSENPEEK